jgi:hypothetical protein
MKKSIFGAFCVVVAMIAGCSQKSAQVDYATISFFIGDVNRNGSSVAIGDPVSEKDSIITGAQSSCDIKIGSSIIRVKEKSKLSFSSLAMNKDIENTTLDLGEGRLLCKPKKLLKDESFTVKTPTAIAAVRGTEFTVEADAAKTTRIKVYDGKVKVAKRIKPLEDKIDKMLEVAPSVEEKESIIITEKEVIDTEKKVEKFMAANKTANTTEIIAEAQNDVTLNKKEIQQFKVEDFKKETSELIAVKEKEPEILKQIKDIAKLPAPDGRLLITRYEVYFIKNGRVEWEGKIIEPPVKDKNRVYIASEDKLFCASIDGPVLWKKEIINDGKVEVSNNVTTIFVKGKPQKFDSATGKQKM